MPQLVCMHTLTVHKEQLVSTLY